jgi:hypothetical protein
MSRVLRLWLMRSATRIVVSFIFLFFCCFFHSPFSNLLSTEHYSEAIGGLVKSLSTKPELLRPITE